MSINKRIAVGSIVAYSVVFFTAVHSNLPQEELHQHKEAPIKVPSLIDGTPFGINGNEIRKLIFIIREIEKMLHGVPNTETKDRKGRYSLDSKFYSAASLSKLEQTTTDPQINKKLPTLLKEVIEDLIKITHPFIDQARGVKPVTLQFMEEWADKHNKKESFLLTWGREKEGHEFDMFKQEITSFIEFEQFCIDLISFLSDLIQSCPRGWQQFLELQKQK